MDFVNDKMHSLTGGALSSVNEMRRKLGKTVPNESQPAATAASLQPPRSLSSAQHRQSHPTMPALKRPPACHLNGGALPFGGDCYSSRAPSGLPPPPIGFRADLLASHPPASGANPNQRSDVVAGAAAAQQAATDHPGAPEPKPVGMPAELEASSESLYQGDAWARLWFQRVMLLCLLRLLLFIRKVYEDFQATKVYNLTGQTGYLLLSAATLFLPTIVFTVYRVSRYLQVSLPPLRAAIKSQAGPWPGQARAKSGGSRANGGGDDESQLTRALMSSPVQSTEGERDSSAASPPPPAPPPHAQNNEDDGLVTARQTPTLLDADQFHDTKSDQEPAGLEMRLQRPIVSSSPPATSPTLEPKLESVNVDKLGDLPDKETMRVFSGASEQLLHGVLFIFWQLKRQVDVMGYLVERACLWRKPAEREKQELDRLRTGSDGLEWFQDFYAAFLAILAQVYALANHWSEGHGRGSQMRGNSLASARPSTSGGGLGSSSGDELSVSQAARVVSGIMGQQAIAGNSLTSTDVVLVSELVVSSAVVVSLLLCVRRRDDGALTLGLSMLGWGSLFAARIIIIALAFVHIGWHLMLALVAVHILCLTAWLYKIALDSHNGRSGELVDEAKWDPVVAQEGGASNGPRVASDWQAPHTAPDVTSSWHLLEHLVLLAQIVILFAIPSLFYWPIMFNLKLHKRPAKYLLLLLVQNFLLVLSIWFLLHNRATFAQLLLLFAVVAFSLVGFVFVLLYVLCKPSLTEHFARADSLFNEAESCGIYYEFCSRVFKMPDLGKWAFARLMNQTEMLVEEREVQEESGLDTAPAGRDSGRSGAGMAPNEAKAEGHV